MTTRRILHLIDHMGSGGAQTIVRDLALGGEQRGQRVEIAHLFAGNVYGDDLARAGIVTHDLSTGAAYRPVAALDPRPGIRLRALLARRRYDVINLHLYVAPLMLRGARSRAGAARVVNTVHAHSEHLPGYVYPSYRVTRGMTDAFVVDFAASRRDLMDRGVDPARIHHIPFGVEPVDAVVDRRVPLRTQLDIEADAVALLSVARLHPQRHIADFLDLMIELPSSTILLLAGDGPEAGALQARARELGIADRVRFLGRRSDLGDLFAVADVYLSMSVHGDIGIAALQAASSGLPVVAWDIAGASIAPESVPDGSPFSVGAGRAFTDHVGRLVDDPALRSQLGRRGRSVVRERNTAAAMADAYEQLYRDLG